MSPPPKESGDIIPCARIPASVKMIMWFLRKKPYLSKTQPFFFWNSFMKFLYRTKIVVEVW
jgi:hypothetical protein